MSQTRQDSRVGVKAAVIDAAAAQEPDNGLGALCRPVHIQQAHTGQAGGVGNQGQAIHRGAVFQVQGAETFIALKRQGSQAVQLLAWDTLAGSMALSR